MKKLDTILGTVGGALSILFSLIVLGMDTGYTEGSYSYGGDAYTGIQNAASQTANNVHAFANLAKIGLFSILLVIGILALAKYLPGLIGNDLKASTSKLANATKETHASEPANAVAKEENVSEPIEVVKDNNDADTSNSAVIEDDSEGLPDL